MSLACPLLIANHYPDLCRSVDIYCERTTSALDAEPVNALTNAAFLIAAGCAWHLNSRRSVSSTTGLTRTLIVFTAIVGLGSFLFHTVATRGAEWGDVIPILVFMLLFLWLILTCFFSLSFWMRLFVLSLFLAITFYLEAAVPSAFLWGGVLYVPSLLMLISIGGVMHRRKHAASKALLGATVVFLFSFTARTLDAPICPMFPLGTHFLWHILNAVLLYLLVRIAVLYAPFGRSATYGHV